MSSFPRQDQVRKVAGFGGWQSADGYVVEPESIEELQEILVWAAKHRRKIALRGSGRSYGDAAILPEEIVLSTANLNRMEFDSQSGIVTAEAGVTLEDIWRMCLPHGFWPPVVSGTMFPTVGGMLAMNIHGKNAYHAGPIGEHVRELAVLKTSGEMVQLTPDDELFYHVISGAGLVGIIVSAKIQMKKVPSGDLIVTPISCRNWEEQFAAFDSFAEADYCVTWIDAFATGSNQGRGQFHAGLAADGGPETLQPAHQDLPSKMGGLVPKSEAWRILKLLNRRPMMKLVNSLKHLGGKWSGDRKEFRQSLVAFSFLLDYMPNWQRAYEPDGFIQYQVFVPRERASEVFGKIITECQNRKWEPFLAVMKRHRIDRFLFTHGVDGYSLALDFKVIPARWNELQSMIYELNDLVTRAGGKFYFAKDSTLRPEDVRSAWGEEVITQFQKSKNEFDPQGLLETSLSRRILI